MNGSVRAQRLAGRDSPPVYDKVSRAVRLAAAGRRIILRNALTSHGRTSRRHRNRVRIVGICVLVAVNPSLDVGLDRVEKSFRSTALEGVNSFTGRAPAPRLEAELVHVVSVPPEAFQWPRCWVLPLPIQRQLGPGHLQLATPQLLAVIVDVYDVKNVRMYVIYVLLRIDAPHSGICRSLRSSYPYPKSGVSSIERSKIALIAVTTAAAATIKGFTLREDVRNHFPTYSCQISPIPCVSAFTRSVLGSVRACQSLLHNLM